MTEKGHTYIPIPEPAKRFGTVRSTAGAAWLIGVELPKAVGIVAKERASQVIKAVQVFPRSK